MRHILSAALESHREPLPMISMEEEALLVGEAGEDLAQAEAEMTEVERVEDLADALEDLAEVADTITEAQPADLAMVETATRAALAGTDVEVEEVIPALESFKGTTISTEGLRETARRLWDNIVEMLKKVWEKLEGFFYKLVGSIPRLRKSAEDLKTRAENVTGKAVEETKHQLGGEAGSLAVDGKAPKNAAEVLNALGTVKSQGEVVFKKYAGSLAKAGENMAQALADFEIEKAEEGLNKVVNAASTIAVDEIAKLCNATLTNDPRWRSGDAKIAPALPGGKSIVFVVPGDKPDAGSGSALSKADYARRRYAEVVMTSSKKTDAIRSGEFTTMGANDAIAIADAILGICDTVEEFQRGKGQKDLGKARDKLKDAGSKATAKLEKSRKDQGAAPIAHYKSAINFNVAFGRWATSPMGSLASLSLTACRAGLVVANKSLSQYK